jgi:hypothetical protein
MVKNQALQREGGQTSFNRMPGKGRHRSYFVFLNLYCTPTEMAKLTSNWLVCGG